MPIFALIAALQTPVLPGVADGRETAAAAAAAATRLHQRMDANHDGVATPQERMAFLKAVIDKRETENRVKLGAPGGRVIW